VAPSPTIVPTPTATPVAVATSSIAPATDSPRATPTAGQDGAALPVIVAGAAAIVVGLGALAWVLLRR
jgi:hypothetical protein